jgi:hypothetical protein
MQILVNPAHIRNVCANLRDVRDSKACIYGSMFFVLQHNKYAEILDYCGRFTEGNGLRASCYESAFFTAQDREYPVEAVLRECPHDELCERVGQAASFRDPWDFILEP